MNAANKHYVVSLILTIACAASPLFVSAQSYPTKPVRLVVPQVPGSSTDIVSRILGEAIGTSLLYALEVPSSGGNTGLINSYLTLETLSVELRNKITGRTIKHDATHNSAGQLRKTFGPVTDVRTSPGPIHPTVWRHPETGHDALFLGRRPYAYINGMSVKESEELLDALWAHATQPHFAWQHKWRVGDILLWDNRCTMHHRDPFHPGSRRIMHKTACQGTRPTAGQGPQSTLHPRGRRFISESTLRFGS